MIVPMTSAARMSQIHDGPTADPIGRREPHLGGLRDGGRRRAGGQAVSCGSTSGRSRSVFTSATSEMTIAM
jgi:hypothetical protein